MFNKKNILVTGGTGSFGSFLVQYLAENYQPNKIIIYSRDELKQYELQNKEFVKKNKKIFRFFIGDIRDKDRLNFAFKNNIDYVFHAAALKQVPAAEYNPFEAIKTNIIGSQNIIDAAIANNVKKTIALSTDKASSPINLYGATKLVSDKLFVAANNFKNNDSIFSVVRYGNVMGSRGSVIPHFLSKKDSNQLEITDTRMTRFNITLKEWVEFVIKCLSKSLGGEVFVPKIPSYKITDIAKAIAPKAKLKIIGIRPGEKIHEEMISSSEGMNTFEFKDYFIIFPQSQDISWGMKEFNKIHNGEKFQKKEYGFSYQSQNNKDFLSLDQIKNLIKKESYK